MYPVNNVIVDSAADYDWYGHGAYRWLVGLWALLVDNLSNLLTTLSNNIWA